MAFSHSDFFPLIASAIHDIWEKQNAWVTRDQIVELLSQNRKVQLDFIFADKPTNLSPIIFS